ncbi:MAG: putative Phosphoribosyltransferase [Candidatus Saccharibacteria bacterium]|jgi:ComF family protein|nr:putative Phosphoribosyltransferase [Candidatus Saccharibacteria bacterium]
MLLCDRCKYDISSEASLLCIACGINLCDVGVCKDCDVAYSRAWCIGERSGALQRLIGNFKFQNMHAAHQPLASLLIDSIDQLPKDTIVVPIPTVASHIRERGYDHTLLLSRQVANHHGVQLRQVLSRATTTQQRGASRAGRITQAKEAFVVRTHVDSSAPHLLIDDVVTTGATIKYAAESLRQAGVTQIWVAVIARQPLD